MRKITLLLLLLYAGVAWTQLDSTYLGIGNTLSIFNNPAYCGLEENHSVHLNYINKQPFYQPENDFKTPQEIRFSYDYGKIGDNNNVGLGFYGAYTEEGTETKKRLGVLYSYKVLSSEDLSLRLGFGVEYCHNYLEWDYIFVDNLHPFYGPVYPTTEIPFPDKVKSYINFHLGTLLNYKNSFLSIGVLNLLEPLICYFSPTYSEVVLPRVYQITIGHQLQIGNNLSALPSLEFLGHQDYKQFTPKLLFIHNNHQLIGISTNNFNLLYGHLGYELKEKFMLIVTAGIPMSEKSQYFGSPSHLQGGLRFKL